MHSCIPHFSLLCPFLWASLFLFLFIGICSVCRMHKLSDDLHHVTFVTCSVEGMSNDKCFIPPPFILLIFSECQWGERVLYIDCLKDAKYLMHCFKQTNISLLLYRSYIANPHLNIFHIIIVIPCF
jgi:hypothetical protein